MDNGRGEISSSKLVLTSYKYCQRTYSRPFRNSQKQMSRVVYWSG